VDEHVRGSYHKIKTSTVISIVHLAASLSPAESRAEGAPDQRGCTYGSDAGGVSFRQMPSRGSFSQAPSLPTDSLSDKRDMRQEDDQRLHTMCSCNKLYCRN
jgi:hypothetical protein